MVADSYTATIADDLDSSGAVTSVVVAETCFAEAVVAPWNPIDVSAVM